MIPPFLTLNSISHDFANGHGPLEVLRNINFDVDEGEFVCILGPSGSGKSTLLRIIAGLVSPTSGQVMLKFEEIHAPHPGVGMVFQQAYLMPWRTVAENVFLPLEVAGKLDEDHKAAAYDLISLVGLQGFEDALPGELSGGMAQRVAIARALVQNPDVMLLDEPFGGLDAITREHMSEELLRIWRTQRKTVIMVTHDIHEALFLADRVLVFSERPAEIVSKLRVDFSRPRDNEIRYTQEFAVQARKLRDAIESR